jgi:thioredoxin reductase (NADPH)
VDADPVLVARYDELVPVLLADGGDELCHYFIDEPKVREYLGQFG